MLTLTTKKRMPVDITLSGEYSGRDPFLSEISGVFTHPDGSTLVIPGFYRGDGKWSVRFSAENEGDWSYTVSSASVSLSGETSGVVTVAGEEAGVTRILRTKGTKFVDSEGKSVFLLGHECNFLFSLLASPGGEEKLAVFVNNLKETGFNQVQINTYANDYSFRQGRTRENDYGPAYIDLFRQDENGRSFNPAFFDNYDRLIAALHENGVYAQIYLKVYNKYVDWPDNYSELDFAFYRLFTARYQAFPNVIWNISKEGYFEPDKEYFYTMLSRVRAWDAYHHLCTVHDDLDYSLDDRYAHTIDFLVLQQHFEWQYAHLYFIEKSGKPVVGGETGVESPRVERLRRYPAERVCAIAYEIVMAGAYYQYYYSYHAWDVLEYDAKPKGFEYLGRMVRFFSRFDMASFTALPHACVWSGLCLDNGKDTMLIYVEPREHVPQYVNKEGHALVNLGDRKAISCESFGVYTGETGDYDLAANELKLEKERGFVDKRRRKTNLFLSRPAEPTMFTIRYEK